MYRCCFFSCHFSCNRSFLTITAAGVEDEGTYACFAEGKPGQRSHSSVLWQEVGADLLKSYADCRWPFIVLYHTLQSCSRVLSNDANYRYLLFVIRPACFILKSHDEG